MAMVSQIHTIIVQALGAEFCRRSHGARAASPWRLTTTMSRVLSSVCAMRATSTGDFYDGRLRRRSGNGKKRSKGCATEAEVTTTNNGGWYTFAR